MYKNQSEQKKKENQNENMCIILGMYSTQVMYLQPILSQLN